MRPRWNKALPGKHITKFKLHQLVHLLQIQYVNVFCEMQQLRLRCWNFIILKISPQNIPHPPVTVHFKAILSTKYHII